MTEPDPISSVEIYREDLTRLRLVQIQLAGEDGKVMPLRDVIAALVLGVFLIT